VWGPRLCPLEDFCWQNTRWTIGLSVAGRAEPIGAGLGTGNAIASASDDRDPAVGREWVVMPAHTPPRPHKPRKASGAHSAEPLRRLAARRKLWALVRSPAPTPHAHSAMLTTIGKNGSPDQRRCLWPRIHEGTGQPWSKAPLSEGTPCRASPVVHPVRDHRRWHARPPETNRPQKLDRTKAATASRIRTLQHDARSAPRTTPQIRVNPAPGSAVASPHIRQTPAACVAIKEPHGLNAKASENSSGSSPIGR